jgi:plastocyanin
MSRTLPLAVVAALLLIVSACSGGTSASAPASAPAASEPAASEPAASEPAASESGGTGEAACAPSTETGTVAATIAGFAFDPPTITAGVGDVVTWTNNDSAPHTATMASDATCTTETLGNGASGSIMFNVAGSYDYFCKIHSQMTGTVEVS